MKPIRTFLFVAYFCLAMIVLGGTIFSVMVEYPNWFADVPSSLEATRTFYRVLHPGYFFQIFGPLMVLTAIAFIVVGWNSPARNPVLISLLIFIAIEMLTFIYIYPRLGILFAPTSVGHSVETLKQAASEFTVADRIRTAMDIVASGVAVYAMLRFFREPSRFE